MDLLQLIYSVLAAVVEGVLDTGLRVLPMSKVEAAVAVGTPPQLLT